MTDCSILRPMLVRVAEGDAGPDEALAIARHLPDCTACRILLAREVRLESALGSLEDPVPVDEGFLAAVMRALPAAPNRRRKRVALTLVGGGSAIVLAVLAAGLAAAPWPSAPRLGVQSLDAIPLDRLIEFAGAAAVWVRLAVEGLGGVSGFGVPVFRTLLPGAILAAAGLAAVCVAFSALFVAVSSGRLRPSSPRG